VIRETNFTSNTAGFGAGGAISVSWWMSGGRQSLIVDSSHFTNNTAVNSKGFGGGAISCGGAIIIRTIFSHNAASVGGAIKLSGGETHIDLSAFENNTALQDEVGLHYSS
jgi:hypothetical protein